MRDKGKFQFSNATAQRAEAHLNVSEACALLDRWVPRHLQEQPEQAEPTTAAGRCFRKVTAILEGREK